MFAVIIVAVSLASFSSAAFDCPGCNAYGGDIYNVGCTDPSLTSIPDCVYDNVTILGFNTPSIPLVPEQLIRFTNLKRINVAYFDDPIIHSDFLLYQSTLEDFEVYKNNADYIDYRWLKYAPNITKVNFSFSKISSIASNTFSSLSKLNTVYLTDNQLTTLPATLFEGTSLHKLYLDNNPWHCDCDLMQFLLWTKDHGVLISANASCWYPLDIRGMNILDLTEETACAN